MKAYKLCMLIQKINYLPSVLLNIKDILSVDDDWVYNSGGSCTFKSLEPQKLISRLTSLT